MIIETKLLFIFLQFFGIDVIAITLFPFIFINPSQLSKEEIFVVIKHEKIHVTQYLELFIIGFYLLYFYYWIKNLILCRNYKVPKNTAYYMIPFEIEAFVNENTSEYLKTRTKFSWKKYTQNIYKIRQQYEKKS